MLCPGRLCHAIVSLYINMLVQKSCIMIIFINMWFLTMSLINMWYIIIFFINIWCVIISFINIWYLIQRNTGNKTKKHWSIRNQTKKQVNIRKNIKIMKLMTSYNFNKISHPSSIPKTPHPPSHKHTVIGKNSNLKGRGVGG